MPRATKQARIVYPSGVKEISADLSTDDLVQRLRECAQAFQNMSPDDDNTAFVPLAMHLALGPFLEHPSKDVRQLIACSIADVFRVFAPEPPYKDADHLKTIFEFFIEQLQGLEDPQCTIFKQYSYLLENLAWWKTFTICFKLEESQEIFTKLFVLIFSIVNDNHSNKVKTSMLYLMCSLILEADNISQQLIDTIFAQIIDPRKTKRKHAYTLAKEIIKRTSSTLEPYVHAFFNNALILGKSESSLTANLYNLIYELNALCPNMLTAVLPQLEFKLKSAVDKERLDVTKLLARMFSDKSSDLALKNESLWKNFLSRFKDVNHVVRLHCVKSTMHFLVNHPYLRKDISEQLRLRQYDPDETVRFEVVMAIIIAAKKDVGAVSEQLLDYVKERTSDEKFNIRYWSLFGVAALYKQHMSNPEVPDAMNKCIGWIKNKVLHLYYQTALRDRLLVENILHTCLVPYQSPLDERIKKLYQLFCTVDEHAVKAFHELLLAQNTVRSYVKDVLDILSQPGTEFYEKNLNAKLTVLSRTLPEPIKSQEHLKKFFVQLDEKPQLKAHMETVVKGTSSCNEIELSVKELLKSSGLPVQTNSDYTIIKQVLERIAPIMVDLEGIKQLLYYIKDSLLGVGDIDIQLGLFNSAERGLQLLQLLSSIFSSTFCNNFILEELLNILSVHNEVAVDTAILIFTNVGHVIASQFPNIWRRMLPLLQQFINTGSVQLANHAARCLFVVTSNNEQVFPQIIDGMNFVKKEYKAEASVKTGDRNVKKDNQFFQQLPMKVEDTVQKTRTDFYKLKDIQQDGKEDFDFTSETTPDINIDDSSAFGNNNSRGKAVCTVCGSPFPQACAKCSKRTNIKDFVPKESQNKTKVHNLPKHHMAQEVKKSQSELLLSKFITAARLIEPKDECGIAVVKDNQFKCVKCDQIFKRCSQVCLHYKRCKSIPEKTRTISKDSILWLCLPCQLSFNQRVKLRKHKKRCSTHGSKRGLFISSGKESASELKTAESNAIYWCTKCSHGCTSPYSVIDHECELRLLCKKSCHVHLERLATNLVPVQQLYLLKLPKKNDQNSHDIDRRIHQNLGEKRVKQEDKSIPNREGQDHF